MNQKLSSLPLRRWPGVVATLASAVFTLAATAGVVNWNFDASDPEDPALPNSAPVAGLTVSALSRGNNNGNQALITNSSKSSGYEGVSGNNNAGAAARIGALNTNENGSAYFEFTLTPDPGGNFGFTSISFGSRSTASGPKTFSLRSSLDDYGSDIATGVLPATNWALVSVTALPSAFSTATTYRIYGYDGSGNISAGTTNWRIDDLTIELGTAGEDTTPPSVTSLSPANGAIDVPLDSSLTITFNKPVQAGGGFLTLYDAANPGTPVEAFDVTTEVDFNGSQVSFAPSPPLAFGVSYYVTIDAGAILDTASPANAFAGFNDNSTWAFSALGPDLTGPAIAKLNPANGGSLADMTDEMWVIFDEPILAGTGMIRIYSAADDSLVESFDVMWDAALFGDQLYFYPNVESYLPGESYYVQMDAGLVTDNSPAENAFAGLADKTTWTFSIKGVPAVTAEVPYTQDFASFGSTHDVEDVNTMLPDGWRVTTDASPAKNSLIYRKVVWGDDKGGGTASGFRSDSQNPVLGFQHTGSTGKVQVTLTLANKTGSVLTDLTLSYTGRVAREGEGRAPAFTVSLNGVEVPALGYSTGSGDGVLRSVSLSDLSIEPEETFTITWASERGAGTGSSRQIGLSDVMVKVGADTFPPSFAFLVPDYTFLTPNSFTVDTQISSNGGSDVAARGFVYAKTSENQSPELGGSDVIQVPIAIDETSTDSYSTTIVGLEPGTSYSVRAYATNAKGTSYSSVLQVVTLAPTPLLRNSYTQKFDNFSGTIVNGTFPAGWMLAGPVNTFAGTWGPSTSSGGLVGNVSDPGVLGYQHTGTTGRVDVGLTLINDTGGTLDELYISYLGRVARAGEGRAPEWKVRMGKGDFAEAYLDYQELPDLDYSTESGVDQRKTVHLTGLGIAPGASFTIMWRSSANVGSAGARRQIGIADVYVGMDPPPVSDGGYDDWASANHVTGGPEDAGDQDGIPNLMKYALGLVPGTPSSLAGSFHGSSLSFTAGAEALANDDVSYAIETSADLQGWQEAVSGLDEEGKITYELPAGVRIFARLRVTRK